MIIYKRTSDGLSFTLYDLRLEHTDTSFPDSGPNEQWIAENGYSKETLEDPEIPEDDFRADEVLGKCRWEWENRGVDLGNGTLIQSDQVSRINLIGARMQALENPLYTIRWKAPDGFVVLDAGQIIAISDIVALHVQKCFAAEMEVLENIEGLTTVEQVVGAFGDAYLAL